MGEKRALATIKAPSAVADAVAETYDAYPGCFARLRAVGVRAEQFGNGRRKQRPGWRCGKQHGRRKRTIGPEPEHFGRVNGVTALGIAAWHEQYQQEFVVIIFLFVLDTNDPRRPLFTVRCKQFGAGFAANAA